jgi:hypothetical protein
MRLCRPGRTQPASQPAPRAQEQGAWREAARARLLSTEPSGSFAVCSASGCRDRAVMWRSGTAPDVSQFRVRPRSLSVGVSASRLKGPRVTLCHFCPERSIASKKSQRSRVKPEPDDACARRAEALYDACRPAGAAVLVRPKPSQLQWSWSRYDAPLRAAHKLAG